MAMHEAWCGKCKEVFVPDSPTELEHAECMSIGEYMGFWCSPEEAEALITSENTAS